MPIYLDEVPENFDRVSRPSTFRWIIILVVILLAGMVLTLWQWTGAPRGISFWFTALGLSFYLWGLLAVFRHIGYRLELKGEAGWNYECDDMEETEISRGRRFSWVLDTWVQTSAGRGTGSLSAAMIFGTPLLKTGKPRAGGEAIRHARIREFDTDPEALTKAIEKAALRINKTLDRLPEKLPCWLMFDCDADLSVEKEAELLQLVIKKSGRALRQIPGQGMNALDYWLDNHWIRPSALVVLTLTLRPSPQENDAEAIASMVLCNRKSHQYPDAVRLHRPQKSSPETLTHNIAHSLRWAELSPEAIKGIWIAGEAVTDRPGLNQSCEDNKLKLSLTDGIKNIDATLGYVGQASPWIAVALATCKVSEQGAQLVAAQPDPRSDDIWLTSITAEEREKDVIRE
ncbi:hypothetical protein [Pantoea sp. Fr+CA_20]|uniref:hypothetical protein n=1 Tax=Pantoea TaxID=53335 RepID=UPI00211985EC|nr:hypothetical protein [Pantoea sp. Fr+CA_20]